MIKEAFMNKSLIISMLLLLPCLCMAQRSLEFYYLVHDHNGQELVKVVDGVRASALDNAGRTVYFYMPDGDTPHYFKVSAEDSEAYSKLTDELKARVSHTVYPDVDRQTVCDILSDGFASFDKVIFNFFVSSGFVQQSYGDAVISRLYWDMDLDSLPSGKCQIKVFSEQGDKINNSKLFGRKTGGLPVVIGTY